MSDADTGEGEELIMADTGLAVAEELAEMEITKFDLDCALVSLTLWTQGYRPEGSESEKERAVNGSLFRDGITQFVSCFDSKNRFPLVVETVYPNATGVAPYFKWLRNLRNSYTAHRHGAARQCSIAAVVRPGTGAFLGHSKLFAAYVGPSQDGHAQLLAVVSLAIRYVEAQILRLQQQFIEEASAIPPEQLLMLPRGAAVQPQGPAQIGMSRGDVRKAMARELNETIVGDIAAEAQEPR
ncbi:hypothetical protein ABIF86_003179 [Bradyrhizobium japonicum]